MASSINHCCMRTFAILSSDPALEFGTVQIYTCSESCWANGDKYRTEYVVVQADPDQRYFAR